MGLINRETLLKKEMLKIERVDLDEHEYVFVRQMTARERDRFEQSLVKEEVRVGETEPSFVRSIEDFRAKLAVLTICDEQGNRLLEPEDYATLSQNMSAAKMELIIDKAQQLNRISKKDREALVKNSGGGQAASSNLDSVES